MRHFVFALLVIGLWPARGHGQCSGADSAAAATRIVAVGTPADDSSRFGSLIGACWGSGSLIRSSLSLSAPSRASRLELAPLDPSFRSTWNSRIPVSFNDGAMWAGRGLNVAASAGFLASYRFMRVVVDPQVVSSQNEPFPVLPSGNEQRSGFASPWRSGSMSADLPLRFGDRSYTRIDPGETTVEAATPLVAIGVSAAEQWWGPGIRNALVMSNNAAGIPRAYVRSASPVSTRFGDVEAQWMLGGLEESPFFDRDDRNNLRSVSAAVVSLRVAADTGLTIGAARAVYANVRRFGRLPGHLADVFTDWHRPPLTTAVNQHSDQLTSLFARWVIPDAGLAAHVEWAKPRLPSSVRELFVSPDLNQGFTIGVEWATSLQAATMLRTRVEMTTLEQTPLTVGAATPEFYTSHAVLQGFTQEGQTVGATIGPSSSSQYVGASILHRTWQFDVDLGRIRWEDGAYYREPSQGRFAWRTHDVSFFAGIGARHDSRWMQSELSLMRTIRLNYLFQTPDATLPDNTTFDVRNTTLSFVIIPHLAAMRSGRD